MVNFNKLYIQDVYVVLIFRQSLTALKVNGVHYNPELYYSSENCRVARIYAQLKYAKRYQKRLEKQGSITGIIKRKLYDKW